MTFVYTVPHRTLGTKYTPFHYVHDTTEEVAQLLVSKAAASQLCQVLKFTLSNYIDFSFHFVIFEDNKIIPV